MEVSPRPRASLGGGSRMLTPCASSRVLRGATAAPAHAGAASRAACRSAGQAPLRSRRARARVDTTTRAGGVDELGGREPTGQEIEFGFQERVLYNGDTEHIRMIPSKARALIELAGRKCTPIAPGTAPLAFKDAELLRKQVLDWKLVDEEGVLRLRRVWRVKDAAAGQELVARITSLVTAEGHTASGQVAGGEVTMELMTPALRGLSENDFIVAAKADALSLADLVVAKKKTTFYF